MAVALLDTRHRQAEQREGFFLQRCRPREKFERLGALHGQRHLVECQRRQMGNEIGPVHHGEAVAGFATTALLHGRRRWLGRGDD